MDGANTPSRTRSLLNLTSSTLFGIYQPTEHNHEREELSTPWGTGARTPAESPRASFDFTKTKAPGGENNLPNSTHARRKSTRAQSISQQRSKRGFKAYVLPTIGRSIALCGVGVLYGLLITHLHDRQELAPVKVEVNRSSWMYLAWWGLAGMIFGEALPWVDKFWTPEDALHKGKTASREHKNFSERADGWIDVVRSFGAFIGIAFAIRKLPWQSTLQLSLTLALANPAIWFIVDRSPPGFILSSAVALCGTLVLLAINPALLPSPTPAQVLRGHVLRNGGLNGTLEAFQTDDLLLAVFTQENVGVATWIASVLFVSSVCFGNIGRRLSPQST